MRLFLELTARSFKRQLAYRAATFAGLVTNFFFGILRIAVLVALYHGMSEVAGLSIDGAITFTGLTQSTIGFLSLFGWFDLMNSVYDGSVAVDLLKPLGLFRFWLAQDLGRAAGQLLFRGLPMLLAYALLFGISTPGSILQWGALFLTMLLGWLVSFSWRFLVNLTSFWVPNAVSIGRFFFTISWFLSGFLMPLRFFPGWFIQLCQFTPFPHALNTIVETYLGLLHGVDLIWALVWQLTWFVGLFILSQITLKLGIKRLVIQGG
jgi:ABC-2 type transport system permease protein